MFCPSHFSLPPELCLTWRSLHSIKWHNSQSQLVCEYTYVCIYVSTMSSGGFHAHLQSFCLAFLNSKSYTWLVSLTVWISVSHVVFHEDWWTSCSLSPCVLRNACLYHLLDSIPCWLAASFPRELCWLCPAVFCPWRLWWSLISLCFCAWISEKFFLHPWVCLLF